MTIEFHLIIETVDLTAAAVDYPRCMNIVKVQCRVIVAGIEFS